MLEDRNIQLGCGFQTVEGRGGHSLSVHVGDDLCTNG